MKRLRRVPGPPRATRRLGRVRARTTYPSTCSTSSAHWWNGPAAPTSILKSFDGATKAAINREFMRANPVPAADDSPPPDVEDGPASEGQPLPHERTGASMHAAAYAISHEIVCAIGGTLAVKVMRAGARDIIRTRHFPTAHLISCVLPGTSRRAACHALHWPLPLLASLPLPHATRRTESHAMLATPASANTAAVHPSDQKDQALTEDHALQRLSLDSTPQLTDLLRRLTISVAAWKGGVGKTELAKEIAWLLDGVLIDFDWDRGGVSRAWGYRHETRTNAPLLDAIEAGRTPRPLSGGAYRADLVPSHPDWGDNQPDPEQLTEHLERWSRQWQRPVIVDTHPGGGYATYGAIAASHVIVVPVVLETRALEALEGMADELRSYPLLVIPNMINAAPRPMIEWLQRISETYTVPVGPPIGNYSWLRQRRYRMAVAARRPVPAKNRQFVSEITAVTRAVVRYAAETAGEGLAND